MRLNDPPRTSFSTFEESTAEDRAIIALQLDVAQSEPLEHFEARVRERSVPAEVTA